MEFKGRIESDTLRSSSLFFVSFFVLFCFRFYLFFALILFSFLFAIDETTTTTTKIATEITLLPIVFSSKNTSRVINLTVVALLQQQ